jgi:hypothetical protein
LRQQIEEMRKNLADLEGQLAAEEQRRREAEAAAEAKRRQEQLAAEERMDQPAPGVLPATNADSPHHSIERTFGLNIVSDQKAFWTSPLRIRLNDAPGLFPFFAVTGITIASDNSIEQRLPSSPTLIQRSRSLSNYGTASLAAVAGGLYLWGKKRSDDHAQETGFLAGEALADGFLDAQVIKFATGRNRPLEGNGRGGFWQGGSSFPSEHAAAAWSVASIIAHEYPGPLTKLLAYGAASGVSAARVISRQHFTSDVLVGSALGWYVGRQVYRAHHNPELDGAQWGTFEPSHEPRKPENMGSPYVPLDTWIYPAFDRLAALGYVHTGFADMRPWTRMECTRLVQEAGGMIDQQENEGGEAARLYRALANEFSPELSLLEGGGRNVGAQVESVYTRVTGIAGSPLTDGYHFGQTIINDYGRPYQNGFNNVTGISARATAGPLVFYFRGEYQHAPSGPALSDPARQWIAQVDGLPIPSTSPVAATNRFEILDAYAGTNSKNWQITFGKQSLWWGPGPSGPMMFSNNAEPIAMLRLNRVTPFKLPSILGWLGPMRTEFFLGQLTGSEFVFSRLGLVGEWGQALNPQPFIHGQRFSFKPTPNFEFGFSRTTIYGGPGYPLTWHTFISSLFTTGNETAGSVHKPGDRRSGLDFTYRIPKLRKWLTFYGDGFTDDQFSPVVYPDRSAWHAGIYAARIPGINKLDFRAEGVYTDNPIGGAVGPGFYYFNGTWRTGYRNAGDLIGSWIGRGGQGAQAWGTYWLSPRKSIQFNYRHQKVSKDFVPNGGTLSDVGVRADLWVRPDLSISSNLQYEQWNFPVLVPKAQSNVTGSLQLTFWPSHWKLEGPR